MNEVGNVVPELAGSFAVALGLAVALAGCGSNAPPENLAPPDLFQWAEEQFAAAQYDAAASGFEAFLIRDPLNPLTDSAQYMLAEARLRDGDELEAAEAFSRLATGRPNSPLADDAQFGACRAYLEASPRVSLSQEFTERAIEECRRLLQFFPGTPLREAAERQLEEARGKLAAKSFMIGEHYFDDDFYESARIYFEKSLSEGPPPELVPELLEKLYRSYTRLGFDTEARRVRERLLSEFPESEEAERVAEDDGG